MKINKDILDKFANEIEARKIKIKEASLITGVSEEEIYNFLYANQYLDSPISFEALIDEIVKKYKV